MLIDLAENRSLGEAEGKIKAARRTHLIAQAIAAQAIAPSGAGAAVWSQTLVALKVATLDATLHAFALKEYEAQRVELNQQVTNLTREWDKKGKELWAAPKRDASAFAAAIAECLKTAHGERPGQVTAHGKKVVWSSQVVETMPGYVPVSWGKNTAGIGLFQPPPGSGSADSSSFDGPDERHVDRQDDKTIVRLDCGHFHIDFYFYGEFRQKADKEIRGIVEDFIDLKKLAALNPSSCEPLKLTLDFLVRQRQLVREQTKATQLPNWKLHVAEQAILILQAKEADRWQYVTKLNAERRQCQITLANHPDLIAGNQVEIGFMSLKTPEEFQAKRTEIEVQREELQHQHDAATARAVRLSTVLRPGDQAMTAALEPFFKKDNDEKGRTAPTWSSDGTGMRWDRLGKRGHVQIAVRDAEPDLAAPLDLAGAPPMTSFDYSRDKLDGKYRWRVDQADHVIVECGYFALGFSMGRVGTNQARRVSEEAMRRVDLDGLAALKPVP
jgi:hypothetical protein